MYIRNCTSKNQKVAYYMLNTSITGISPNRCRNVIGLPRLGGPSSQIHEEKEITGVIADNHK